METIVSLLPFGWQPKAKSIIAAIGLAFATAVAVVPVLPKWVAVVVAALTYLGVYQTPAPGYVGPEVQVPV